MSLTETIRRDCPNCGALPGMKCVSRLRPDRVLKFTHPERAKKHGHVYNQEKVPTIKEQFNDPHRHE